MRRSPGGLGSRCMVMAAVGVLAGCASYQSAQAPPTSVTEPTNYQRPTPVPKATPARSAVASRAIAAPRAAYRPAGSMPDTKPAGVVANADEATCTNVDACASVLKAMIADPRRSWMQSRPPPSVLANGVRLFAYRALRGRLTCQELAAAASEVDAAAKAFRWGVSGVGTEEADRAQALSAEVGQELRAESTRRCDTVGVKIGTAGAPDDAKPIAR